LTGVSQPLDGLRWESDCELRVGRLDSLEIVLHDSSISRRHADVVRTAQGWVVRDLGSTNGTLLNGEPVHRAERRLKQNDLLQFGKLALRVVELEVQGFGPSAAGLPRAEAGQNLRTSDSFLRIQTSTQRSWNQALEAWALGQTPHPLRGKSLLTLLRTNHHLTHIASLDELLRSILADTVAALDAQRGSIVLADEASGELRLRAVVTPRPLDKPKRSFSKTLASRSFQAGESLLCADVHGDEDLLTARSVSHGTMSSIICAVLRSPRKRLGVLHLDRAPLQEPFNQEEFYLADAIAASVSVGIESARLFEKQRELFINTVSTLARAVEMRDQYTGDHTQRVTDYALMLAEALQLSPAERYQIQLGTPLHDIGKIGVDDAVLRKPAKLTPQEFEQMKAHTWKGAVILQTIPDLAPVIPIIRHHHERWDGTGYPDRLASEQISPLARIVAVADAFDAMTSDRPYRPSMSPDQAFQELRDKAGSHFDPECVQAFMRLRPRVEARFREEGSLHQLLETLPPTLPYDQMAQALNQIPRP
jgi:HD-GYP domain-containing protein (c-di-GMP phosphodiesterase class II)